MVELLLLEHRNISINTFELSISLRRNVFVIFLSSVISSFTKLRDFRDTSRLLDNTINAYRSVH